MNTLCRSKGLCTAFAEPKTPMTPHRANAYEANTDTPACGVGTGVGPSLLDAMNRIVLEPPGRNPRL